MHIGTIWKKGGCSNIFDFGGQKKEKEKKGGGEGQDLVEFTNRFKQYCTNV